MPKFRKKPVVVEAMQLPPLRHDADPEWVDELHKLLDGNDWESGRDGTLTITTLEGDMTAQPGDWIIRGVKGECYPCKPDIFAATYEAVVDA